MKCGENDLLICGTGISQQELWQPEDEVFLHPLPVQRQQSDALRVGLQGAAGVPETVEPLQQLQDLNTKGDVHKLKVESSESCFLLEILEKCHGSGSASVSSLLTYSMVIT